MRHRKERGGGGKIINVTSIHEDIPNPAGSDYDCSKSVADADPYAVGGSTYVMDGGLMRSRVTPAEPPVS